MSQDSHHNIRKHTLIATAAIFSSRILGLVREKVFAYFFGASLVMDAFIVAFRVPNMLRDLLAEGALSQSFTTIFAQILGKGDRQKAFTLSNKILSLILVFLSCLLILGIVFAPQLIHVFADGFEGDKFLLTVKLTRVMFFFILFASCAALYMGMLNALNRFLIPQSASAFFNLTSILSGLGLAYLLAPTYLQAVLAGTAGDLPFDHPQGIVPAITGMAIGTLIGGIVQWLIQLPQLLKEGYRPRLDTNWKTPEVSKVLKLTGPAIIGAAAVQVNVFVNQLFASYMADGSVSYLNYSFRFMQFPLGVFGVAVAVASAPTLARLISQNKHAEFQSTIKSSLQMSLFLSLPSAVGLFFLAEPIIGLIYEGGSFSYRDTLQTAYALMAYTLGICFYSLIKIYQPAYLAFHDAKTPMRVSLFAIVVNFSVNWTFVYVLHWPHWALAIGTSIVAVANFFLLALFFRKKVPSIWSPELYNNLFRISLCTFTMSLWLYFAIPLLVDHFPGRNLSAMAAKVFLPIVSASLIYFVTAFALRVPEARFFLKRLKRS